MTTKISRNASLLISPSSASWVAIDSDLGAAALSAATAAFFTGALALVVEAAVVCAASATSSCTSMVVKYQAVLSRLRYRRIADWGFEAAPVASWSGRRVDVYRQTSGVFSRRYSPRPTTATPAAAAATSCQFCFSCSAIFNVFLEEFSEHAITAARRESCLKFRNLKSSFELELAWNRFSGESSAATAQETSYMKPRFAYLYVIGFCSHGRFIGPITGLRTAFREALVTAHFVYPLRFCMTAASRIWLLYMALGGRCPV